MKVLHLNSELIFGGGLERIIVDLMTRNKAVKNYMCIVNDKWSQEYISLLNKDSILLCDRKEGTRNPIINVGTIYKTYKFIKKNNIKVIHCHDTFSLKYAYLLKKLIKIKVVFTVHDTNIYNEGLNKYPVDKYIAISESVYTRLIKYIPRDRIELIYNGVNLNRFKRPYRYSDTNTSKGDTFTISCVARIMPEKKGQDILIKALNVLKNKYKHVNFKCYFAGASHNEESMKELNELVKKFHLENNIKFLGNVENMEKLYANTDVMVLPSRYEGFGLVVVEALAAGCCVVVSKLEGPLEIIKDTEEYGLHFEKEDYMELAEKLHLLLSDKDFYKKYNNYQKITNYLEKNFSLENMIKNYNKIYNNL
ncbi:glycosyltransferase family 4 protein [Bacillus sp. AFS096315]|uniref:glycosyltransferase family 4 protein n=1 Tax=Bacillus sp. AFS096315 TaxID=2033517 RepID=UPI000BEBEE2C|nr:glycosyltransferase family 4 protein [Bacillus sp. AFS096315]PEC51941.1 hypothetical protein CON00_00705 [Bacillus sp. AFS096315]